MTKLHGIHHVTAVTAQAKRNKEFYTEVLGLRLVKKTVNQDDTSAYHLFYADALGSPGTDMTFFDWPQAGPRQAGSDEISRTYFRIKNSSAISYWKERLEKHGLSKIMETKIDGQEAILFEDFEGQRLGLVKDVDALFNGVVWEKEDIPIEYALRGFYAVQLTVPNIESVEHIFVDILSWEKRSQYVDPETGNPTTIFSMDGGGPGKEVHVLSTDQELIYGSAAGGVHHVAFRVRDEIEIEKWQHKLEERSVPNSGIVERYYFKSLYFPISRGILFEIATDGPGFAVDEDQDHLGERLALPPFLESKREAIESNLKPLE